MKREELKKLIDTLEAENRDSSYLGIFYVYEGEATCIRGNQGGFIELGLEALKVAYNFGEVISTKNADSMVNLKKGEWFDRNSEVGLELIEGIWETRQGISSFRDEEKKDTRDKIRDAIGFSFLAFILISILVGGYNIVTWIIQILSS